MKEALPKLYSSCIITDREAAITKGIENVLPSRNHFYCWNHIKQDIKFWVKKQKNAEKQDYRLYISHTVDLLESESIDDCLEKYKRMSEQWSKNFRAYFETYIFDAVKTSGKWELTKRHLYTAGSGITINPAESFNAVLKRCLERKEVKAQVLALTLYQLDLFYRKEIIKGYCGLGNYCLKPEFSHLKVDAATVEFPRQHLPLDQLPYVFENKDLRFQQAGEVETVHTKYSAAKMIILQGSVRLVPSEQVFVIRTPGEKRYMVSLFPAESCTCQAKTKCHHIEAAHLSIGNHRRLQKNVKLSTIMKRKRGYR